jgi:polyhydroxyalkanoate synthesis regulator phasin
MATSASTGLIGVVRSTVRKLNALAEGMDRTPYDDLADRVSRLEQELTQLKKERRRVDAA